MTVGHFLKYNSFRIEEYKESFQLEEFFMTMCETDRPFDPPRNHPFRKTQGMGKEAGTRWRPFVRKNHALMNEPGQTCEKCTRKIQQREGGLACLKMVKNGQVKCMNKSSYSHLSERRGGLSNYLSGKECLRALWLFKFVQISKIGLPRRPTALGIMKCPE